MYCNVFHEFKFCCVLEQQIVFNSKYITYTCHSIFSRTLTRNIRERRGEKVVINLPSKNKVC